MTMKNLFLLLALAIAAIAPARAQFSAQQTFAGVTTGSANAIVVSIPDVASLSDLLGVPVRFVPSSTNTGSMTVAVGGTAATALKKTSSNGVIPLTGGEITSGVLSVIIYDGTQFVLTTYAAPIAPLPIQTNTTWFVSPSGSDTNNSCLVSSSPCQTIQYAWNTMVSGYNLNGHNATIQLAAGTYTAGLSASSMPTGVNAAGGSGGRFNPNTIIINGVGSTTLVGVASDAIVAAGPVGFTISNMTVASSTQDVSVDGGGTIAIGSGVTFGAAGTYQMLAQGGTIVVTSSYTVSAGAQAHVEVALGGTVVMGGTPTITFTGSPTFSTAVFQVSQGGSIYLDRPAFSGAVNGTQWLSSMSGGIFTGGATCSSYIPGTSGGSNSLGGYCN